MHKLLINSMEHEVSSQYSYGGYGNSYRGHGNRYSGGYGSYGGHGHRRYGNNGYSHRGGYGNHHHGHHGHGQSHSPSHNYLYLSLLGNLTNYCPLKGGTCLDWNDCYPFGQARFYCDTSVYTVCCFARGRKYNSDHINLLGHHGGY